MFNRVAKDLRKYSEYIAYSTKSNLKINLSGRYLGYFWWILDPLMNMIVYVLVIGYILGRGGPDYPLFVYCAVLPWKWFSTVVKTSADSIKKKMNILQQVYLPKFILPLINNITGVVYFFFGLIVLFVMLIMYKTPLSLHIFESVFIIIVQFTLAFGLSLILSHMGVFFKDISNILLFTLKFWFYMSPGFYSVYDIPEKYQFIWWLNPITSIYESYRNVFMYAKAPLYLNLLIIFLFSLVLIWYGVRKLYLFDRNYTKVS